MHNFLKLTALVCAVFMSASCSTAQIQAMDELGGLGVLTDQQDQFDGTRRVKLTPAFIAKSLDAGGFNWTSDFKLGAQWNERTPDRAMLIIELAGGLENISGVGFNLGGQVSNYDVLGPTQFETNTGNKWIPVESTAFVDMALDDLIRYVQTDGVQVRFYLLGGQYADANFGALNGTGGALTARYYLMNKFLPVARKPS